MPSCMKSDTYRTEMCNVGCIMLPSLIKLCFVETEKKTEKKNRKENRKEKTEQKQKRKQKRKGNRKEKKTEKKGKQMYASLLKESQQVTYPGVMLDAI